MSAPHKSPFNRPPYDGAVSHHWPKELGGGWFVNLYVWRRGPTRLEWHAFGGASKIGLSVELPTNRLPLLHHWLHFLVERSAGAERKRQRAHGEGLRIGPLRLHRKEQWDLRCRPWLCVHWSYDQGNGARRVFCLWSRGAVAGRLAVRWWLHPRHPRRSA